MGGQFSKPKGEALPVIHRASNLQYTAENEISSIGAAALRIDPNLQSIYTTLQVGIQIRGLSYDSLIEIIGTSPEVNQEVVQGILDDKIDAWKDQELFQLVKDFFQNNLQNLDSCKAMEQCLMKARDNQSILSFALQPSEKQEVVNDNKYLAFLQEELKNFKAAENPFSVDFFLPFVGVKRHQGLMLEKLQLRKNILDKKIKSVKTWRKVLSIIFGITFISSVVVAAIKVPNVVSAMAAIILPPVGSVSTWFNSLWTDYENALEGQIKLISSMHAGTFVAIKDLDAIEVAAGCLSEEIQTLTQNIDVAPREGEAMKILVQGIQKKVGVLLKNLEDLTKKSDTRTQNIQKARTVVLERMISGSAPILRIRKLQIMDTGKVQGSNTEYQKMLPLLVAELLWSFTTVEILMELKVVG